MVNITNEKKLQVTVQPKTELGNPAVVDGPPKWVVSDTNVVSLQVAQDGLSAWVIPVGSGTATVTVSADADLTQSGVRTISNSFDVVVTQAEASVLVFLFGDPQPL